MKISADLLIEFLMEVSASKRNMIDDVSVDFTGTGMSASARDSFRQVSLEYKFPPSELSLEPVEPLTINISKLKLFITSLGRFKKMDVDVTVEDGKIVVKSEKKSFTIAQVAAQFIQKGKPYPNPLPNSFTLTGEMMSDIFGIFSSTGDGVMVKFTHSAGKPTVKICIEGDSAVKFELESDVSPELPAFAFGLRIFSVLVQCNSDATFRFGPDTPIKVEYVTERGIKVEHILAPMIMDMEEDNGSPTTDVSE